MEKYHISKRDMAEYLVRSAIWTGVRSVEWLCKNITWEELHYLYQKVIELESEIIKGESI